MNPIQWFFLSLGIGLIVLSIGMATYHLVQAVREWLRERRRWR